MLRLKLEFVTTQDGKGFKHLNDERIKNVKFSLLLRT